MAITMNIPFIVKILCPPLLFLDIIRRAFHLVFIVNICQMYHAACKKVSKPLMDEIRQFLSSTKNPTVVEYGAGPYPALDAYPNGTNLIVVDPCPDFDSRLQAAWDASELSKHGTLLILTKKVEDVDPTMVESGTVDVVVSRMANCSVTDNEITFKNVHRMLKSGGRYYFWDHVLSENPAMQIVQYIMSFPLLGLFTDCTLVRKPWELLKGCGFTDVKVNRFM